MEAMTETLGRMRLADMRVDPVAAIKRKHNVDLGWECPDCQRAIKAEDWSANVCPCGRPYPIACGRECGSFVHPPRPRVGQWYDCYVECESCSHRTRRGRVLEALEAGVPRVVLAASRAYSEHAHRTALVETGADWLNRRCGRSGGWSSLYVHGNTGSGKSVGVARLVEEAMLIGAVTQFLWVLEEDLVEAAKSRFRDDSDSGRLIEWAKKVELLVVDELFSRAAAGYTDNASLVVGSIFRSRFDDGLPTLITSNSSLAHGAGGRTLWSVVFDSRVESRWHAVGHAVACQGPDLRVRGGAR